jgi:hypothetical protein
MRMLTILVAVLSMLTLAACSGAADDSERPHRGPYIGGGAGVGF